MLDAIMWTFAILLVLGFFLAVTQAIEAQLKKEKDDVGS